MGVGQTGVGEQVPILLSNLLFCLVLFCLFFCLFICLYTVDVQQSINPLSLNIADLQHVDIEQFFFATLFFPKYQHYYM